MLLLTKADLPEGTGETEPLRHSMAETLVYRGQRVIFRNRICWFGWSSTLRRHLIIPLLEEP